MSDLSLKNLFFPDQEDGDALNGASLISLENDIKEHLPGLSPKAIQEEMSAKLGEVLDVGLGDVMAAAWEKATVLLEYADPAKHPPEETILLPLAKHSIKSAHAPHVDLKIKDILIGSLRLKVQLLLELEGVVLKVQGGRIRAVQAGSCQASGSLACHVETKVANKELLNLKKQTPELRLAGAIDLGEGIAIPRPGEDAES